MPNERKPDEQDHRDFFNHMVKTWAPTHNHWRSVIDPWY